MKKIFLSSALSVLMLSQAVYADFLDVPSDNIYYDAVKYFSEDFPIISTDRDNFNPAAPVTNAEFYKLLLGSAGFQPYMSVTNDMPCVNITGDEWFVPYLKKALELNLVNCNESSTYFNYDGNLTRLEGLKKIFYIYDLPYADIQNSTLSYKDVNPAVPYAGLVETAYNFQLLSDFDTGYLNPNDILTRGETVHILLNAHKNIEYLPDIGLIYESDYSEINSQETYEIFLDVWDKINSEYIGKDTVDQNELLYGAITGMVDRLGDPYSVFFEPTDAVLYQESLDGSFEGIGIYINEEDGNLVIVTPLKGSPAEKAGLKPGDIILEVDNVSVENMSLSALVEKLRGQSGTTVKLKIQRETLILEFNVVRSQIEVPYVESEIKNNIGIIHYYQFTGNSHEQFVAELKKITEQNPKGLILDFRNNPGGYLTSAQDLISHFLPENTIYTNLIFADGSKESERSYGPGELSELTTVILINEGTASASEIIALALKDTNNSKIVGTVSYGKGKIQEIITYNDNSSLKLSIAKWTSPNGTYIDEIGIIPNYTVQLSDADIERNYDPQMEKALELFNN
jgi:carboxyl-terminal processing protease